MQSPPRAEHKSDLASSRREAATSYKKTINGLKYYLLSFRLVGFIIDHGNTLVNHV